MLAFRPSDEKKPLGDLPLEDGDAIVCVEDEEEREVLVDIREVTGGVDWANEGYGRGGGPRGGLTSPLLE